MTLVAKHVVITGASRGIGAAAAAALGRAGASLTLLARDGNRLSEVAGNIAGSGGKAWAASCDVSDYAAVAGQIDEARERFGPIDILINNAGVIEPTARIVDSDPAVWARNIEINLIGAYNMIRAVLSGMIAAGSGRIVNLSSSAGFQPLEGWSAYCAAKAGLAMLTRAIALEAGTTPIRVFGLSPGTTDTDMHVVIRASGLNRVSRIPRESLRPVDVAARQILYLCTTEADDLSGSEVAITDPEFSRRVGVT